MELSTTVKDLIISKHEENYPKFQDLYNKFQMNEILLDITAQLKELLIKTCSFPNWNLDVAHDYKQLAHKLQQFAIYKIIAEEKDDLTNVQLVPLLSNKELHISLLACSLQLLLFSHNTHVDDDDEFNMWIYTVLDVHSFHIFKVLNSFQNIIFDFPAPILQHFVGIEQEIIEYSLWKLGSPIYDVLNSMKEFLPLNLSPKSGNILSPLKVTQAFNPSSNFSTAFKCPTMVNDENVLLQSSKAKTPRPKIICLLLKKVYEIIFLKVKKFAQCFNLPRQIEICIIRCFEYCINRKSIIFENRHLDQILMCCIYSVCKLDFEEVTFKNIINAYRTIQPEKPQQIWKTVWMNKGDYHDTIIAFYNCIFIDNIKQHLFSRSPTIQKRNEDFVPAPLTECIDLSNSPKLLGADIRVKMMEKMLPSDQFTPRSTKLYSFGNSPLSSLKCLSQKSVARDSRAAKHLKFDSALDKTSNCAEEITDDILP